MNKYLVNGKFNFNSNVEILIKRKNAHIYLADTRFRFIDSLVGRITELAEEVQYMKIKFSNQQITSKRYINRLTIINRSIEYNDAIIRRMTINEE